MESSSIGAVTTPFHSAYEYSGYLIDWIQPKKLCNFLHTIYWAIPNRNKAAAFSMARSRCREQNLLLST